MKKFLKNIIIKSLLIGMVCLLLGTLTYSIKGNFYQYYEQDEIVKRAIDFNKKEAQINTVFIGSSRIFRHIIPFIYDSMVDGANAYNLAYAGLFPYRSYDYLNYLALEESKSVKKVFIELSPIALLGQNYNTDPFIYSTNLRQYVEVVDFCLEGPHSLPIKIKYLGGYSLLVAYKYLGIGASNYFNLSLYGPSIFDTIPDNQMPTYKKGFLSLDDDFATNGDNFEDLISRKKDFNKHYKKELNEYTSAYNSFLSSNNKYSIDKFSQYIIEQAKMLESHGIEVAFIISPRQELGDLLYVKNQKKMLSNFKVHDFSNPDEYPALFTRENSFDRVHLNEKGATLFTKYLAEKVNRTF